VCVCVCKCVLYYCHRESNQLQLKKIYLMSYCRTLHFLSTLMLELFIVCQVFSPQSYQCSLHDFVNSMVKIGILSFFRCVLPEFYDRMTV
jgi:hypothetical protein